MKNTEHDIDLNEELRRLDHALRFHLSESKGADTDAMLESLNDRIDYIQKKNRRRRFSRWFYPVVAAAVAAVAIFAVMTFSVTGSDEVQMYANRGESPIFVGLPDGTQVWLNPGTELSLNKKFNTEERKVRLTGEAYFDVTHNPDCPFIVTTGDFRIKVLGTVFNVKALPDESNPEVSLAQGSVAMQNLEGVNLVRLRPGQQAIFDKSTNTLEINDIYVGDMLMRHYGAVSLHGATIKEIVSEIEDVYGVKIATNGSDTGATYNFSFQKDSKVGDILDMLEFVCADMKFSLE